jgi:rSAM/selenodomain-associated transferase 1
MGKASTPGRAKTRLMPSLTAEQAAALNTAFLKDTIGNLLEAGRSADVAVYTAYGPAGSEHFFREHLPAEVGLIECSLPNFGDCLLRALTSLLDRGHAAACVINSDSPTLPTAFLTAAVRALSEPGERIVLGPCEDGGYYLLGLKRVHRRLFTDIDWSTAHVCRQTAERAAELGLPIFWLNPWYDVDDSPSLERLHADLNPDRGVPAPGVPATEAVPYDAPHTRAALHRVTRPGAVGRVVSPSPARGGE